MILSKKTAKIGVIVLAAIVISIGAVAALKFTEPHAVTQSGTKVEEPWVVKIGDKEAFVVADEKQGEEIIENVKKSYYSEPTAVKAATMDPEVKVEKKKLDRGEKSPTVVTTDDAVDRVLKANESESPLVKVTTTEQVTDLKKIDYKVKVKKVKKLYKGEKKVAKKGKKGKKSVVSQVTRENGKVVETKVIYTEIEEKPVAKVVNKGIKKKPDNETADKVDNDGAAVGKGSGSEVINYATKFLGNPYVYGGSSLTNGTDCSGFTMSIYAHFGVSLPHSSSAQRSCGKGVSYSEAKPGDILCYSGHVALYMGNGKIIHASTPSTGITTGSATYKPILTVRRIIE